MAGLGEGWPKTAAGILAEIEVGDLYAPDDPDILAMAEAMGEADRAEEIGRQCIIIAKEVLRPMDEELISLRTAEYLIGFIASRAVDRVLGSDH